MEPGGPGAEPFLERLRSTVDDLARQVAAMRNESSSTDRWMARIQSVETRLSMAEATLSAEAERVRAAAETVKEAMAASSGFVNVGRTLADRLAAVENRLGATVAEAVMPFTDSLLAELNRTESRERAVATALDGLTVQLNEFTGTLAAEVRRAGSEQAAQVDQAVGAMQRTDQVAAAVQALRGELAAALPRLDPGARLDLLSEEIERVVLRVDERIATIGNQLAFMRDAFDDRQPTDASAVGPELQRQLGEVAERLDASLRATTDRTAELIGQVASAGAVELLLSDMAQLRRTVTEREEAGQPSAALDPLIDQVAGLRHALSEQPSFDAALAAAADRLGMELVATRAVAERIEAAQHATAQQLAADLGSLRDRQDPTPQLTSRLDGVLASIEGMAEVQNRLGDNIHGLAEAAGRAAPAELLASIEAARAEIGALSAAQQHAAGQLGAMVSGASEATLHRLDELATLSPTGDSAPVLDRVAGLADGISALHRDLEAIVLAIHGVRDQLTTSGGNVEVQVSAIALADQALQAGIERLSADLAAVVDSSPARDEQLRGVAATADSLVAASAENAERLDIVQRGLRVLAGALPDLDAALTPIREAVDQAATAGAATVDRLDVLAGLSGTVERLEASMIEAASRLEAASGLTEAVGRLEDFAGETRLRLVALDRIEHTAAGIDEIRSSFVANPLALGGDLTATEERIGALMREARDEVLGGLAGSDQPGIDLAAHVAASLDSHAAQVHDALAQLHGAVGVTPGLSAEDLEAATARGMSRVAGELEATLRTLAGAISEVRSAPAAEAGASAQEVEAAATRAAQRVVVELEAARSAITAAVADRDGAEQAGVGRVEQAVTELRGELALVRRAVDGLEALRSLTALGGADDTGDGELVGVQLDALGDLLSHAVRSLHVIEAATVGVGPKGEKARLAAAAAIEQLRDTRKRRAST